MSRQHGPGSSAHDATEHMASSWRARVGPAPGPEISEPPSPNAYGCLGCGGAACDCDFCVWERLTASVSPVPACGTGGGHDGWYWWDGRWWQWMPTLAGDASSEEGLWRQVSDDNSAANSDERWANHVSEPGSPSSPRTPPGLEPASTSVGMRMSAVSQATRPSPAMQQWPPPPPPLPQGPVLAPERAGRRGLRRPSPTPPSIAIPVKVPPVASAPVNEPAPDREPTLRGADAEPSSQDASSAKPADAGAATPIPVVATEHSGATDDYQGLSLSDGAAGSAASSGASDRRGRQDWGRRYDAGEQSQSQAEEPQQESWLSLEGTAWHTGWSHWRSEWDSWSSWQG